MGTQGPIDPKYKEEMHNLARWIDEFWNPDLSNKKVGFALLIFPFGHANDPQKDRINYISNAAREDMTIALKELLARWTGMDAEGSNAKN